MQAFSVIMGDDMLENRLTLNSVSLIFELIWT
jgi:hypothetical protein